MTLLRRAFDIGQTSSAFWPEVLTLIEREPAGKGHHENLVILFELINAGYQWPKPVLVLYRERHEQPEREAIAVIKAQQLTVMRGENDDEVTGSIVDFFPLMGSLDVLADTSERYVLCWFDDDEDDVERSWRRLTGVTFPDGATWTTNNRGKRTYRATFHVSRSA